MKLELLQNKLSMATDSRTFGASLDSGAARLYLEAARLYQSDNDQLSLFEAAVSYEEAYKAYNMDKKNESMYDQLSYDVPTVPRTPSFMSK